MSNKTIMVKSGITIEYCKEVAQKKDGLFLSKEVKNKRTKYQWQCREGHIFDLTLEAVEGKSWCDDCAQNSKNKKAIDLANTRNVIFKSKNFKNTTTKYQWECSEGHLFDMTYKDLAYERDLPINAAVYDISIPIYCNKCIEILKLKERQDFAEEYGYTCLSTELVKDQDYMEWECPQHGMFSKTYTQMKQGNMCRYCGRARANDWHKKTAEDYYQLADLYNIEWIGKKIPDKVRHKTFWLCQEDHIFPMPYADIKNGHGCQICANCYVPIIGDVRDYCDTIGYICLDDEYVNATHYMNFLCPDKHKVYKPIKEVRSYGCKYCYNEKRGESQRLDEDYAIQKASEVANLRGGKFIGLEDNYKNNESRMKFTCHKNHTWTTTYKTVVTNNTWCPKCRQSKMEHIAEQYLKKNNYKFKSQYTFSDLKNIKLLQFDFCIKYKGKIILLEMDGKQHTMVVDFFGGEEGFEKRKYNDKMKSEYCFKHNYPLIRVSYDIKDIPAFLDKHLHDNKVMFVNYDDPNTLYIEESL